MKVCYLILAHNNFIHLERLVKALDDEYASSFYIHIDKKVRSKQTFSNPKINIIPEHFDIQWGTFSMVKATLALFNHAMNNVEKADYYILLSGVDYPIRSKQYLQNLLSTGKEYIDIASAPVPYKPMSRFEYYYFNYDRRNLKHYNPKFLLEVLLKKIGFKRKIPFQLYVGSQWFALTYNCIQYILEAVREDKRYVNFFSHSLISDEAFFQTIIGNSPFIDNVATSLVYTDWDVPVPPAMIEERHIKFLEENDGFQTEYGYCHPYFARKFQDNSESIIKEIEERLRK